MKNYSILKAAICSVFGLALAACADKAEYTPAPQEDSSKTYVRVDDSAPRSLDVDGADIVVPLIRNNASGALDVTVALEDTSSLFTLNSATVSFADGETTANAVVSYSYDSLDPAATYSIAVSITSEGITSEYAPIALPMQCKKAWQNLGMAQFYDDWWVGGPFEKQLLKAPDGTETYRLVNPWDQATVVENGFEFVSELPYIEFYVAEDGSITYEDITLGFTFSGMSCHMWHPATMGDADGVALNVLSDNVATFYWYPVLAEGASWWGTAAYAFISFPGGPDLSELLGLGE